MASSANQDLSKILCIDIETSGPDPSKHQVLAIAAMPLVGSTPPLSLYIHQDGISWDLTAQRYFEAYKAKWLQEAVSVAAALAALDGYAKRLGPAVMLAGHNVSFDRAFLMQLSGSVDMRLSAISHRVIDTHSLLWFLHVRGLVPESALSSDGAFRHFGIRVASESRHTALGDVIATQNLLRALIDLDIK